MSRRGHFLFLSLSLASAAFGAETPPPKCPPPDTHRLAWTRTVMPATVPAGVEIYDRVWLKNPTAIPFITFTPEKGAEARTGYREILGEVPTTKDELPGMKLVGGERFEYHYPENPVYRGSTPTRGGWVRQDYPAGLIQPSTPVVPPALEERIFSGKTKTLAVKAPIFYYFGKKRGRIDVVFEFTRNPKFGIVAPGCPTPGVEPSPLPTVSLR